MKSNSASFFWTPGILIFSTDENPGLTDRKRCNNKNTWCIYKLKFILFISTQTYKELITIKHIYLARMGVNELTKQHWEETTLDCCMG
jgi:hypothetical protein